MGLNVNVLRRLMLPPVTKTDDKETENDGKTNDKPSASSAEDVKSTIDNAVNTYTYFQIYDGITSRLGNFYSETLAKMTGPAMLNKRFFSQIYNGTLNNTVNKALEDAKSGKLLDFNELAQNVKDQITTTLEACNYDPVQYQKNLIDQNIQKDQPRFNK